MTRVPSRREHLDEMTCLATVSGHTPEKTYWTDLSIYYREDDERPFIAVKERVTVPGSALDERFNAWACGSVHVALNKFDETLLRERLEAALPEDLEENYPDANTRRMAAAASRRGYSGAMEIKPALEWLYDDIADASPSGIAKAVERDFGVPWRTVYNALTDKPASGWASGFLRVLPYFDKARWRSQRKGGGNG